MRTWEHVHRVGWGTGGGPKRGQSFHPNQGPPVPRDALNVKTVTAMRRTWESTATSAR